MKRGIALELGIIAFALLTLVLVAAALMDLVRRPPEAWEASGAKRETWIALLFCSTLLPLPGVAAPLWYLLRIRPRLVKPSR